jgi:hypothetical protein
MNQFKAPENYSYFMDGGEQVLFLAGTIDMGDSVDWQEDVANQLNDVDDLVILNPRRDNWDNSWEQSKDHPQFNEQVTWELEGLRRSDIVFFNFLPSSKSPITMMELGYMLGWNDFVHRDIVVCCPKEFYRKGNVDIICDMHYVKVYEEYQEAVRVLRKRITGIL